jgi:hypothetical protein
MAVQKYGNLSVGVEKLMSDFGHRKAYIIGGNGQV